MATFLVAHGAWSAGWAWKKMRPLMRAAGHAFWTPTYTGLGERAHLARPEIDLDAHIQDVLAVLDIEDLRDVYLIGHSYGGMVATGVADRARDRIKHLIYVDAFAPKDGQAVFDLTLPEIVAQRRAAAKATGDGWRLATGPMPPDTSPDDVAWATPRRKPQPINTFEQKLKLSGEPSCLRTYIYAKRARPDDGFRQFLERSKREGWYTYEIDASHNPHITCPDVLMGVLAETAAR
jgi:pimeloyl-ACP methyl ester carboxylesterase